MSELSHSISKDLGVSFVKALVLKIKGTVFSGPAIERQNRMKDRNTDKSRKDGYS